MAKLVRLQICGVRNFSPKEEDLQSLRFSTPVTLFLGQNGCGKTTIIESLRYACTGDVPAGTNNGQNFIHDPKISNSTVTKALVALKIKDINGRDYAVSRISQVTQKNGKLSFQSVDNTISAKKANGGYEQLPGRCADIGAQFCNILGVSKPILNYVIFCHQDESLWPLDEGKSLKEKFDKIFAVESYTKSVDTMLQLKKDSVKKVADLRQRVLDKEKIKARVENDMANLQSKKNQLDEMNSKVNDIILRKEILEEQIHLIRQKEEEIIQLERQVSSLQSKLDILEQKQNESIRIIDGPLFEGTDEDLDKAIDNFHGSFNKKEANLKKSKDIKENLLEDLSELTDKISKNTAKLGSLKKECEDYQARLQERLQLLVKCATGLDIMLPDHKTDLEIENVITVLKSAIQKNEAELEKMKRENLNTERNLQSQIDDIREKKVSADQDKVNKQRQIDTMHVKTREIENKLRTLASSSKELQNYRDKVSRIDEQIKILNQYFNATECTNKIQQAKLKIATYQNELESLKNDEKMLEHNAITEFEIEKSKASIIELEKKLTNLKNNHSDNLNRVLGEDFTHNNYKMQIDQKQKHTQQELILTSKNLTIKDKELATLQANINMETKKLATYREKVEKNTKIINNVCKGKNYTALSQELRLQIEGLQKDKGQYSSAKVMYETFTEHFQKTKPCCPICKTDFDNNRQAAQNIVTSLQTQIKDTPREIRRIEQMLVEKQEMYEKVLSLGPLNDEITELSEAHIPILQSDLEELKSNLATLKTEVDNLKEKQELYQKILDQCNSLSDACYKLDYCMNEIKKETSHISNKEEDIIKVASNKTRIEVKIDIDNKNKELEQARLTQETETKLLMENKDKELRLKEERNRFVTKQLEIENLMQGQPQLEQQLKELKTNIETIKAEISTLENTLRDKTAELEEAQQNKSMVKAMNDASEDEMRRENSKNTSNFNDLQKLQGLIVKDISNDVKGQFERAADELQNLKHSEHELKLKINECSESISKEETALNNFNTEFKKLQENKALRQHRKDEKYISSKKKMLSLQVENATQSMETNERRTLEREYLTLQSEEDKMQGQKDEIRNTIKALETIINSPEYRNAFTEYRETFFQWKVVENVGDDMKMVSEALEWAILKYHEEKMQQINDIIRQYWMQIYRGNDIEHIAIKTEILKGTAKRRNYNYRVVQMKNGVELDMRGRCSAGQKVLACLIIRIALAETFSNNCGILALDEPTTNLDSQNIASLSEALAGIIETRRQEKNFQLLVITHDEEFINTLMQVEDIPFYYKVERNDKGNSQIKEVTM